jgi:hypothetical protein
LCGVALGTGDAPKATVKVAARGEVGDRAGAVEAVECAEEGQRGYGAVEEARVRLAKGVACEDARGLLQAQDNCFFVSSAKHRCGGREGRRTADYARDVEAREGIVHREDLDGAHGGKDVCVVSWVCAEGTW